MLTGDAPRLLAGHVRFRVLSRSTVLDADGRRRLGLDHWPDGTVGRFLRDGKIVTVGPNGDGLARTELVLPRWRDRVPDVRLSLRPQHHRAPGQQVRSRPPAAPGAPEVHGFGVLATTHDRIGTMHEPADYVAGGPVHFDAERDLALLAYHAEEHAAGEPRDFYATLGLAASRDGGATWTDLGRIVRAELPRSASARSWGPVEMGPGTMLWTEDRLVVLFGDVRADGRRVNLAAAAAPRREVLDAAARGSGVGWRKWDGTAFATPGLGGRAAELLDARATFGQVAWTSAVRQRRRRRWVLVATTTYMGAWTLTTSTSTDGVHWSRPTVVEGSRCEHEALYVSAHGPLTRSEVRELGPDGFAVLRVVSRRGAYGRWEDAEVERLVVAPTR